ncbi:hypothetical protein H257_15544 [Aphanomyces astaci]|uniref:Peptidase C51 domain-containing protein n=1 Tax=Aphanomyces astaci TaxID=112090 RepID=W4FPI3_APHAT|nr:hypothetical protein H257_15544 [Aphanomyces astaci]ETV68558.1 hypothetical protein H257_15544 [Aphanomyces astaci]|eukprot:XP_009841987.1 hypothetical protein H257_15544 [Aphanomyces astaci]
MPSILRHVHTAKRPHPSNQVHVGGTDTSKAALHVSNQLHTTSPQPQSLAPLVHHHLPAPPTTTSSATNDGSEPFGTILGTFEGVDVKSCLLPDNKSALDMERATFQGHCTGVQWQCVELARRYLLQHHRITFDCIPTAHDMFDAAVFRHAASRSLVPTRRVPHGTAKSRPTKGSLLLWKAVGRHAPTGHVAVVVDATDTHVDIIEQNFCFSKWPEGRRYSRRLPLAPPSHDNAYVVATQYDDEEFHGWISVI